jgi:uncharacterized heparinase superfamily protein
MMNLLAARLAGRGAPARGFRLAPEPRSIGRVAVGRQLVGGIFHLGGVTVEAPGLSIWAALPDTAEVRGALHGFGWLDDLAALGDGAARARAQVWLTEWLERYGGGRGPGWSPDVAGRRLMRWIHHAVFLLEGPSPPPEAVFLAALGRQVRFLARRWPAAAPGLPRFEALTGLLCAILALDGPDIDPAPALEALERECHFGIDPEGRIPTRNPEELLTILSLLAWTGQALAEAGRTVPQPIRQAMLRAARTLRGLRHADGGLARFHGGGRGIPGRLEQALAAAGSPPRPAAARAMGFARLSAGRTSLIIDAGQPPSGPDGLDAHAATLAFELTSGRRPVIVNCGPGRDFGPGWHRAGRATPSHSTLCLDGLSSSRLADWPGGGQTLADGPTRIVFDLHDSRRRQRVEAAHDGWRRSHGLTHARTLDLRPDGRALWGEDVLCTIDAGDRRAFDRARAGRPEGAIPFAIRFHLHPGVDVSGETGTGSVLLRLKSGEVWVLRAEGAEAMRLEPSVHLEPGRLAPRPTQQVVLSGRAMSYATRVRWTLSKTEDTPGALRDVAAPTDEDEE